MELRPGTLDLRRPAPPVLGSRGGFEGRYPPGMIKSVFHGSILELSLARPPANALSPELIGELEATIATAPQQGAGAVVLSGRPGMFSAGLDVPLFVALDRDEVRAAWRGFFALMRAIALAPIPVACALTGHAPAGGCVLALASHHRVMAEGPFKIGLNEVAVGVRVPGPIWSVARHVVGDRRAEHLCTSAGLFEGAVAHSLGLVDELAPPEQVVPRAVAWASSQLELPAQTLRRTREICRSDLERAFQRLDEAELEAFLDEWFAPEAQAALQAVVNRLKAKKG
jgi:3,2-trans-enoyl-CoA isomerase